MQIADYPSIEKGHRFPICHLVRPSHARTRVGPVLSNRSDRIAPRGGICRRSRLRARGRHGFFLVRPPYVGPRGRVTGDCPLLRA